MQKNNLIRALVSLCAVSQMLVPLFGYAYEVDTHKEMSLRAARQSSLQEFLLSIGLKSLKDPLTDIDTTHSIENWISQGAHDEDDTLSANFFRYRNHFFDPQHGGAGYSYGLLTGEPSPDWALEDTRTFTTQSYSLKAARQYFYDALTLPNKDNREMWMARTFYTLGHVIHHIEDMAQPQHVRNDPHYVLPPDCGSATYLGKLIKENPAEPGGISGLAPGQTSQNVYAFNPSGTHTASTTRRPS